MGKAEDSLRRRIDELLTKVDSNTGNEVTIAAEVVQGAVSIMTSLYGSHGPPVVQMQRFVADLARGSKPNHPSFQLKASPRVRAGDRTEATRWTRARRQTI